jgi:hypothetical protein
VLLIAFDTLGDVIAVGSGIPLKDGDVAANDPISDAQVMIVVPVLITSCQVSLKPKIGPVTIQTRITPAASAKVFGRPQTRDTDFARRA